MCTFELRRPGSTRYRRCRPSAPPWCPACRSALDSDLGWALGAVFRAYVKSAEAAVADLPGGPRGYQVLAAAARDLPRSQLALAQQLGVDRTVMTYLLDDLGEINRLLHQVQATRLHS